jgi:hypothetical protein
MNLYLNQKDASELNLIFSQIYMVTNNKLSFLLLKMTLKKISILIFLKK